VHWEETVKLIQLILSLNHIGKVCVTGPKGAGKSTFINAIISTFEKYWRTVKPDWKNLELTRVDVGNNTRHITTSCQEIPLTPPDCPIQLFIVDVWGDDINSTNHDLVVLFQALLSGWLKDKSIKAIEATANTVEFKSKFCQKDGVDLPIDEENRMSSVIFIDPIPNLGSGAKSDSNKRIELYLEEVNKLGIQSCLVRTKIDQLDGVDEEVLFRPELIQEVQDTLVDGRSIDENASALKKGLAIPTGFSQIDTFPLINPCVTFRKGVNGQMTEVNTQDDEYLNYKVMVVFCHACQCAAVFQRKLYLDKQEEIRSNQTIMLSNHPELIQVPMIGQEYLCE
jgi:energy-coupling factor transporter ATP-binding protein EcfA2